ncbi:hypothetical protein Syun_022315 [Stephania yunnanensis]|uniref:Uncharacterized protein n=1 Tax=Stephania yunnanensis TaxID=152371 RepID=A0AAP0I345_9MAGN
MVPPVLEKNLTPSTYKDDAQTSIQLARTVRFKQQIRAQRLSKTSQKALQASEHSVCVCVCVFDPFLNPFTRIVLSIQSRRIRQSRAVTIRSNDHKSLHIDDDVDDDDDDDDDDGRIDHKTLEIKSAKSGSSS